MAMSIPGHQEPEFASDNEGLAQLGFEASKEVLSPPDAAHSNRTQHLRSVAGHLDCTG